MSSWAKPGVKCVLVDCSIGKNGSGWAAQIGDICEVVECKVFGSVHAVRVKQVDGRWENSPGNFARTSRFRPLITHTQDEDLALFRHHLDGLPIGVDA